MRTSLQLIVLFALCSFASLGSAATEARFQVRCEVVESVSRGVSSSGSPMTPLPVGQATTLRFDLTSSRVCINACISPRKIARIEPKRIVIVESSRNELGELGLTSLPRGLIALELEDLTLQSQVEYLDAETGTRSIGLTTTTSACRREPFTDMSWNRELLPRKAE
jgi:hypothetical protein